MKFVTWTRCLVSIILAGFIFSTVVSAQETQLDAAAWREDVEYLRDRLPEHHPNLYHKTPQADFDTAFESLLAKIPDLTDEQIVTRISQIISLIQDGHSSVPPFWNQKYPFHFYPLRFYLFEDGLFVIDAMPSYEEAIGAKVVGVGEMDFEAAYATLNQSAFYENEWSLRGSTTMQFGLVEVLVGAGVIQSAESPSYLLEKADGETFIFTPEPVSAADYVAYFGQNIWRLPMQPDVLYLSSLDAFWLTYFEDTQTIYVQYNGVVRRNDAGETTHDLRDAIENWLATDAVQRVIVDLRHNPGGDIGTSQPLVNLFADHEFFQEAGNLILLTSRNTFSAAVWLSLQWENQAILMGEPTGGNPHMFENPRSIILPNSGLHLLIATRQRQDVPEDDPRTTVGVDVAIPLTSADYFAGNDPVLTAALSYES